MDEGVSFTLDGFDEFNAKLDSLKAAVAGRIRMKALRAGAEIIFNAIQAACPHVSGRTASELRWEPFRKSGGNGITIYYNQHWPWTALFLEKGTKQHRNFFGQKISSAEARKRKRWIVSAGSSEWRVDPSQHAFMGKAFAASAPAALAAMAAQLRADIESAASK